MSEREGEGDVLLESSLSSIKKTFFVPWNYNKNLATYNSLSVHHYHPDDFLKILPFLS